MKDSDFLLQQAILFEKLATQTEPFTGQSLGRKLTDEELARAIRLDLEAELDAINLYESHLEATDNKEAIAVLKHVIKEEKDHKDLPILPRRFIFIGKVLCQLKL